jgi:WD40 repeat protein
VLLKPFVRQSQLQVWADPYIQSGQQWRREIDVALARSRVAVVLLSPDLLASDFVAEVEIPTVLFAARAGELQLLIVPIARCAEGSTRFLAGDLADFQWVWSASEPLDGLSSARRNAALVKVTNAIVAAAAGDVPSAVSHTRPPTPAPAPVVMPGAAPGVLYGVPPFPPNYIHRGDTHEALKRAVLGVSAVVGVAGVDSRFGLHGQGGIGKTVLAMGLVTDEEVRRAFPDGIYWLTLGQQPPLESLQASLAEYFGERRHVDDVATGIRVLRDRLQGKACLLVLDDVWQLVHAKAFDVLDAQSRLVVTTRDSSVLTALGARHLAVDALPPQAALELLARWAGLDAASLPSIAHEIVEQVECLPLGLSLAGAQIRDGRTWEDLLTALREGELIFLDHPYGSILKSIQASVEALDPADAQRYLELAVFPEDAEVPTEIVERFWAATGSLAGRQSRMLLTRLASRNLLRLKTTDKAGHIAIADKAVNASARHQFVSVHDLQHDFMRLSVDSLPRLHERLVETFRATLAAGSADDPDSGDRWATLPHAPDYPWRFLAYHLKQAHRDGELQQLLTSANWMFAKLSRFSYVQLAADYRHALTDPNIRAIRDAVVLSAHVLSKEPAALMGQLAGRLRGNPDARIQDLVDRVPTPVRNLVRLHPRVACLTPPGGPLLQTLEGHTDKVWTVTLLPDGLRALSGSLDGTLKLWDLAAGAVLQTFVGHVHAVTATAVLADAQRAVSGSADCTLKLWDLASAAVLQTFEGHTQWVRSVAVLTDQQWMLSGGEDREIHMWDLESGALIHTFSGHRGAVRAIVQCDADRALSASADRTLRLWDLESRLLVATFEGHTNWLNSVAVLAHGQQALTASDDGTIKQWDLASGALLQTLTGHAGGINSVTALRDGRHAISAGDDGTVKLWDLAGGRLVRSFDGHADWVRAVTVLPDGQRALSGSDDGTLKLWDMAAASVRPSLEGHTGWLRAVVLLPDGERALSGSVDGRLKLWDLATGLALKTVDAHSDGVTALALMPDRRRALSASDDGTVRLCDVASGTLLQTFEGHTGAVFAIAVLPGGEQALSASYDRTLRLWDVASGRVLQSYRGHTGAVNAVAVLPDGHRAVSASADRTVKLWDLTSGAVLHSIHAHDRRVWDLALMPDGERVLSAGDNTVKMWSLTSGALLETFTGHTATVWAVTVVPDAGVAISASDDRTLKVWDLERGALQTTFYGDAPYCCVTADPSAAHVVAGDTLGRLHILRLLTGERG